MNPIQEMRDRLSQGDGAIKPIRGLRVTADDSPRLPQSNIASSRERHESAGRPVQPQRLGEQPIPTRRPIIARPPRREIPSRRF